MQILFYDGPLLDKFGDVYGGFVLATGLNNRDPIAALQQQFADEQQQTLARLGDTPLSEIASIAAWRRVFSAFGVKPTQYRNAAEALLRRLTKKGDIPSINPLVDLGNLISIRYAVPVAVFDRREMVGTFGVRLATGTEAFISLGSDTPEHPDPGEPIFVDDAQQVASRRWCWRQSAHSAANPDTNSVVIAIEAHHELAATDIQAAVDDVRALLQTHFASASVLSTILSASYPSTRLGPAS